MSKHTDEDKRRRSAPLLWGGGVVAAAVLALGVSGTLSDWSTAIITNNANTVDTASSVVLEETGPDSTGTSTVCTTALTATNTATCTTINKYGSNGVKANHSATPTSTALGEGGTTTGTTVVLKNIGSGSAASLKLAPGACSSVYWTGSGAPNPPASGDNACSKVTVKLVCTGGAALNIGPMTLDAFTAAGSQTLATPLASGASVSCIFTVAVPAGTPANFSGQTLLQSMVWTLSAV